jgi:hypothetical protein
VELFNEMILRVPNRVAWDFLYTNDLKNRPLFNSKMERFKSIYLVNKQFQELLNHTVNVFLRRQQEIMIGLREAKDLCRLYLLEELVIFEILAEEGYNVNMYPGNQLPIIKAIVTGQLKNVSEPLEGIQAVEIKFRPKQSAHPQ